MKKEELEKEAEEYLKNLDECKTKDMMRNAYLASAEPREKQIQALGKRCLQLQKDKGRLTDELTKSKEIISEYVKLANLEKEDTVAIWQLYHKAEQFLNSEVEK